MKLRYIATSGSWSPETAKTISEAIRKLPQGSIVVAGNNNDEKGKEYNNRIARLATEFENIEVVFDIPKGNDWNEDLEDF